MGTIGIKCDGYFATLSVRWALQKTLCFFVITPGTVTLFICHCDGDFSLARNESWKIAAIEYGFSTIMQASISKTKNATDIALAIDAMDMLHGAPAPGRRARTSTWKINRSREPTAR